MRMNATFMDALLTGQASADDVDDWVDRWHESAESCDLDEYLGFTPKEGKLWASAPHLLPLILAARKDRQNQR